MKRWFIALGTMGLLIPAAARAQDPRLRAALPAATAAAVQAVADSARAEGLPAEPLAAKALEGASKGADQARILASVRTLAGRLRTARAALGPAAGDAELTSAAAALYLGVQPADLRRVRAGAPRGRPLATAFVSLAFLVQQGVPAGTSAGIVARMVEARATDGDFAALQRQVAADVHAGATPAAAAFARARGLMLGRGTAAPPPGAGATPEDRP